TDWFRKRDGVATGGQKVILWPDTFNNYFHSGVAKATCEVLEHFGCEVSVPSRPLCCGRPLYDYGMLPTAKYLLRQIIETLRDDIRSGVPLVGAEPSCLAVFRDELLNLFPDDEDAKRLSQESYTLAEFFEKNGWDVPRLHRRVLVHGHCHHKSIMRMDADRRLLDSMGLDYTLLDSGCCGLAGSFGFEAGEKYEVSVKAGERALLPAVRGAERDVLVVTDGFSCRAQIEQFTDRRPIHLAQLLSMAIQEAEPDRRG
ncbi:MAG TPA: heterodisulfide reductase-related iron-sulfur binding cluster, partial [Actinomycetota bacterium]|nr:heterodisulfide reductase-related iron-sulfur binding cluster [Actinomycetota bacterium]